MISKYGDRSMIYQKVYPHLHFLIQKDIDSYFSEDNDNKFRSPTDQFRPKPYWRNMYFYPLGLMNLNNSSELTIYSGGTGMGCGYIITFNANTLKYYFKSQSIKYSLELQSSEVNNFVEYKSSDWNDMIIKVDAKFAEINKN
jgi:hypothetical protein